MDPDGEHHSTTSNIEGGEIDNGTSVISLLDVSSNITPYLFNLLEKQGIYRFYAKILDPNLIVVNETFLKIFYFNCDTV